MARNEQGTSRQSAGHQGDVKLIRFEDPSGVIPPHSTDAEVAVLGAMLLDKEAVARVLEVLEAGSFYHEKHNVIFSAVVNLFNRGETVDIITLHNELTRNGLLERIGGMVTLKELASRAITTANVEHHARIVLEHFLKRRLIQVAREIVTDCYNDTTDALDEVDRAEQKIFEVAEKRLRKSYSTMRRLTKDAIERILDMVDRKTDGITGVPSGFLQLDEMLSGFQPSDLVVLAARPSMGKTALALTIARNAAERKHPVGFFSLEMSAQQLVLRLISADAQINLQALRSGRLRQDQIRELVKKVDSLMNSPIYIDDSASLTPMEFRAKCRRMKMEHRVEMVIVDYLQLMHVGKAESREREISVISHTLKQVAKELEMPVIALSQLNRTPENRADKRPMLSDLRESGSIEQDADVVMFVHRPEYYKLPTMADGSPSENMAEIIIGKQRNGPTGEVRLHYNKELAQFADARMYTGSFEDDADPFVSG